MTFELLFPKEFVGALLGFLAAIVIDLVLGIMVAVKYKRFEWPKVADFYTTKVLPLVGGWAVATTVLRLTPTLGVDWLTPIANSGIVGLSGIASAALIAAIILKVGQLQAEVPAPAPAVTMTVTLPTIAAPTPMVTTSAAGVKVTDDQGKTLPVTPVADVAKP